MKLSQTHTNHFFFNKGNKNTRHAKKKNRLPTNAQKLPTLEIIKHIEEIINNIQPNIFNKLLFIFNIFFHF